MLEVIEYKLSTDSPVLICHGIWKLVEAVIQKLEDGEDRALVDEYRHLLSHCESKNIIISKTACQGVITLVQHEVLTIEDAVAQLMACMIATQNYGAIASTICSLLSFQLTQMKDKDDYVCPFNLRAPKHPLITVLELKQESWRDVLTHIKAMMQHCKEQFVEQHLLLLRPVFFYILCDPKLSVSEACRKTAWNTVMKMNDTVYLQIEIFQWLRTRRLASCIDTNSRLIELAEIGDAFQYVDLCTAVLPLIASVTLQLLKHGCDPRPNLDMISNILDFTDLRIDNVVVLLLAEMICITPCNYIFDIVTTAAVVLGRDSCNRTVAYTFVASIMQWMAYPSILCSDALDVAKRMFCSIFDIPLDNSLEGPPPDKRPIEELWLFDANIHFYTEMVKCTETWSNETILSWLDRISNMPAYAITNFKLILSAIFLESYDTRVVVKSLDMLVGMAKNGGQILSTVLYKLSYARNVEQIKALLFTLPKLTKFKENVPIIVNTLRTLSAGDKPLNYLAIELYVRAMVVEPRCHRYIHAGLIELSCAERSWQVDVTCARAMQYICENHPELGAELVPIMSQTLNRCTDKDGGAACALVLKSISALCVAGVTEVCSTWRVLSPKMNKEERTIVLLALCDFFGDIPHNPNQEGQQFLALVTEVLTKLWNYAFNSRDIEIVEAAFKALTAYKLENMSLGVLPAELRSLVELSTTAAPIAGSSGEGSKMNFVPIPTTCWMAMLKNINPNSLKHAGNFLRHFIEEELYSFRSGIYRWPHGEPLNFKYLPERSPMRVVGEQIRQYKPCDDVEKHRIIAECLRIFSHKYTKPLPPIKWSHLNDAIRISSETRKYGISLACHQAWVSPSAKEFLQAYLSTVTIQWSATNEQLEECLELYEKLNKVCRAVGSNVLGPYMEVTINSILGKVSLEDLSAVAIFDKVMSCFALALKDELLQSDNRSLLTATLYNLMDHVDLTSKTFSSFVRVVVELPIEEVERMTLPCVWIDIPTEKLKKAMKIRAELVLKKNIEVPLKWMNEIIHTTITRAVVHMPLLEEMQRILPLIRLEKSNAEWTLDLMNSIGTAVINLEEEGNEETVRYLCEILFVTVICLSSTDCMMLHEYTHLSSRLVRTKMFPQALASIVQTAHWKDIVPQIMEWLCHMNTTQIPRMYKCVFHNALVCLRNEDYFEIIWMKYLSANVPEDDE